MAGEPLRLAVGEDERVVVGTFSTIGNPQPGVGIAGDYAGPALNLDEKETRRREDQRVDLVNLPFLIDEFEVGPRVPGLAIGKVISKPVQGLALPRELRLGNGLPTAEAHGHLGRSSNRLVVISLRFIPNDFQQIPQPAPEDRTDSLKRGEIDSGRPITCQRGDCAPIDMGQSRQLSRFQLVAEH